VHQVGPLWQLVRASMTIVGMVPPVIRGGDMLVDGGYLNNLPVDVMHSLGVHTVLVVRALAQAFWLGLLLHAAGGLQSACDLVSAQAIAVLTPHATSEVSTKAQHCACDD
jgi:predicted acylesterase/phospholipase RssA